MEGGREGGGRKGDMRNENDVTHKPYPPYPHPYPASTVISSSSVMALFRAA